ncbi:regulator of G-protein signaling 8-like isoform X1 [Acipenser ruthenus]|uniref:regulator of G-protein signaling 8-like isoform X1 n=2 Tax=Acipenser ruthenus TaxID=7906 RepID=UPI00145A3A8F|nr:regulator of G-protein signaling 8-like isoform X1 [Acipenser ruthenus]
MYQQIAEGRPEKVAVPHQVTSNVRDFWKALFSLFAGTHKIKLSHLSANSSSVCREEDKQGEKTTNRRQTRAMKTRLGCLSNKSDSYSDFTAFLTPVTEKTTRCTKLSTEKVKQWTESFDILLSHKYGLAAFRAFLQTEFSEENIEFWMACEDYKKTKSTAKLGLKAKKIYEEFIDVQAAREVNIDFQTREITRRNLQEPTPSCFDDAQGKVHSLMEKDSYPRFLRSKIYMDLLNQTQTHSQRRFS